MYSLFYFVLLFLLVIGIIGFFIKYFHPKLPIIDVIEKSTNIITPIAVLILAYIAAGERLSQLRGLNEIKVVDYIQILDRDKLNISITIKNIGITPKNISYIKNDKDEIIYKFYPEHIIKRLKELKENPMNTLEFLSIVNNDEIGIRLSKYEIHHILLEKENLSNILKDSNSLYIFDPLGNKKKIINKSRIKEILENMNE